MRDQSKTKHALIQELASLRERIKVLEQSESERKRLHDKLCFDSEILANMLEGVQLTCIDDGRIVYANSRFENMFGYNPGELLGKHVSIVNAPGDKSPEVVASKIIKSLKQTGGWQGEVHNLRKDGTSFWCYANVSNFSHPEYGEVWIAVHQDITERKQAEQALWQSEKRFRMLMNDPSIIVAHIDQDLRYTWIYNAHPAFGEGAVLGKRDDEIAVNDGTHQLVQLKRKCIETGSSVRSEITFPLPVGETTYDIMVEPIRDEKGEVIGATTVAFDVTERKQAEQKLRDSESKYRLLAENVDDVIYTLDMDLRYTYISPSVKHLQGFEPTELLNQSANDTLTPSSVELVMKALSEVMELEKSGHGEIPVSRTLAVETIRKDRTTVWTEEKFSLIKDEENQPVGILGISRDITERKMAEEGIHASLREKEVLLNEIHHRVKNNMQLMSSLLDFQARSTKNPELTRLVNESKSRIHSMATIHEKLYDSKNFTKIDLADYLRTLSRDLLQLYKPPLREKDLIIQSTGAVYVDIGKAIPCGLILNELISNALKYAFPGDRQGKLQILINETAKTEIEIVVRDNGMGLPDNIDIHEPQTTGLYLVNGLIKNQLKGQLEVRRDNGTEVRIKFPL